MNVDSLGPYFYLIFVIPGFVGISSYRFFFNRKTPLNGWQWSCLSVLWGVLIFGIWQYTLKDNQPLVSQTLQNPLVAMLTLSALTFMALAYIRFVIFMTEWISNLPRPILTFALNVPYCLIGFVFALISVPKKIAFDKKDLAFVINVHSLWWRDWGIAKGVRALTIGCTILLGPRVEEKDLEHELVHVEQHKRYPIIFPFLYYIDVARKGYRKSKYEEEAYRIAGNRYAAE